MNNLYRIKWLEISAVFLTGAMKFVMVDWLGLNLFYISGVCLFWLGFIIIKYRKNHNILKEWGFQRQHFGQSFFFLVPFAVVAAVVIILYGIKAKATFLNWHIIPIMVSYPFWGLVQQFMMIGLISGNLKIMYGKRLTRANIIMITALLFALAHIPSYPLVLYAFFMEILFTYAYWRWRNLWSLGLIHGWVSGMLYFFVLGRDMWDELFQVF